MFEKEYEDVAKSGLEKYKYFKKNPLGYWILSFLAGAFISLTVMFVFTVGAGVNEIAPSLSKTVIGLIFSVGLNLVIFAGAELFTGNNFSLTVSYIKKDLKLKNILVLFAVCFIGNLVGSIVFSYMFDLSGLLSGKTALFIANTAYAKINASLVELFFRGVLCNMLICLSVWITYKCKSESAKILLIFWCLFLFAATGFEHCIVNMSVFTMSLLNPMGVDISLLGAFNNLVVVTLGNIVGAVLFVAIPYFLISKKRKDKKN